MKRRWIGLAAASLALVGPVACNDDPEPTPTPQASVTPVESPSPIAEGETRFVFYLVGKQFLRFGMKNTVSLIINEKLPSDQVAVSPDGEQAVFVQESSFKGRLPNGDFREPIIRMGPAGRQLYGEALTLGAGHMPVWSPVDGHSVAAIDLQGDEVVYDAAKPPGQEGRPLPGDADWARLAWDPPGVLPDLVPGVEIGEVIDAELAPTEDSVAAVTSDGVVLIDVKSGAVTDVEKSTDAEQVVWGPDGESFAFVRQRRDNDHHVFLCRAADDCRDIFYWPLAVKLVGLSP